VKAKVVVLGLDTPPRASQERWAEHMAATSPGRGAALHRNAIKGQEKEGLSALRALRPGLPEGRKVDTLLGCRRASAFAGGRVRGEH
jgi:hypothetical protein